MNKGSSFKITHSLSLNLNMNSPRLLLTVATLALTFLFAIAMPVAIAKEKKGKDATPDTPVDTSKVVKSVNAAAGTVVIEYMSDKSMHTYKVDGGTLIKVNGE